MDTEVRATIAPGDSHACPGCDANRVVVRSDPGYPYEEPFNFTCNVPVPKDGTVAVKYHQRPFPNGAPSLQNIYCLSTAAGNAFHASSEESVTAANYLEGRDLGFTADNRGVVFFATADPQFWDDTKGHPGNHQARLTLLNTGRMVAQGLARGVVIAGDLIQGGKGDRALKEWGWYADWLNHDINRQVGQPVAHHFFDGLGNHDYSSEHQVRTGPWDWVGGYLFQGTARQMRSATRAGFMFPEVHYSWDWHDVHFVQLNLFPGNDSDGACFNPKNSLEFLEKDLLRNVGRSGRPIVIIHHYGFDPFSKSGNPDSEGCGATGWWAERYREAYWRAIQDYDVIAILTGHQHLSHFEPHGAALQWFNRPPGFRGPDRIPTFVVGAARGRRTKEGIDYHGVYWRFHVTEGSYFTERMRADWSQFNDNTGIPDPQRLTGNGTGKPTITQDGRVRYGMNFWDRKFIPPAFPGYAVNAACEVPLATGDFLRTFGHHFRSSVATDFTCSITPSVLRLNPGDPRHKSQRITGSCEYGVTGERREMSPVDIHYYDNTPAEITSFSWTPHEAQWWPGVFQQLVEITVEASDNCTTDASLDCWIADVDSNEPDGSCGVGDQSPDWWLEDNEWEASSDHRLAVRVRPEACLLGQGREYTIEVRCKDGYGIETSRDAKVKVPRFSPLLPSTSVGSRSSFSGR